MSGFVKKTLKTGLGIFTSRIFGMVRDVAIAAFFGATWKTDAFFVAFAIPNLFRAFFAEGALSSVFMPFLSDKLKKNGENAASGFLTSLIITVTGFIIMMLAVVMNYPRLIALIFMPGYESDSSIVATVSVMLLILMPYLLFISLAALLSCYLNLKGSYYIPNSSTAILNIAMIIGVIVGYLNNSNIMYLCYGVFFGGILQVLFILFFAIKSGYRPQFYKRYDKDVNGLFFMIVPSVFGVGINQINFMVGRILASYLAVGSISYLYFSNRLFQFPLGMFAVAVGTVTLTEISIANSACNYKARNILIDKALNSIMLVMVPATAGLIILSEPIIAFVYGHNNFSFTAVRATSQDLKAYSAGLLFYSVITVISRVFYSDKNIITPLIGAIISFIANLAISFFFMDKLGHFGVALASSLAAFLNFIYIFYKLDNYRYRFRLFGKYILKIAVAVSVMSVVIYFIDHLGFHVLISIVAGCAVYYAVLDLLKINVKEVLR